MIDEECYVHGISIVIPVYQGEKTLRSVIDEIRPLLDGITTRGGHSARVHEVILAYDRGPDGSAQVVRALEREEAWIKAVWLSRNYGQHAATLAGMASSGGDWIVTLDEDGQHDPGQISTLLDHALEAHADLVYAKPVNRPPHGFVRNSASRGSKRLLESALGGGRASHFNSFRLVLGEIGRSVAAYAGTGVYLDVALSWVASRVVTAPVTLRSEGDRPSGYSYRRLFEHFWRMVLTSGTRGLRAVTAFGVIFFLAGLAFAIYLVVARIVSGDIPEGWTSQMVLTSVGVGAILVSLGVIAEYLGIAVSTALGRPAYLIVRDPDAGPLGHTEPDTGLVPAAGEEPSRESA